MSTEKELACLPQDGTTVLGEDVLDAIRAFLKRFCVFPSEAALDAVTLWIAHTHAISHFFSTPRLALLSPEPSSGKTRVLELLAVVSAHSLFTVTVSAAAIFRSLKKGPLTLLVDEIDTVWGAMACSESNERLRAVINAGYRSGATVGRCVGSAHDVQQFPVFCAVAMAGIGNLPETVMSRSIVIRMRRRVPSETIEAFRPRIHESEGHYLRDQLSIWMIAAGPAIGAATPHLPDGVTDRAADIWEPMIAIADHAGGQWPARARAAALAMAGAGVERPVTLGVRLLTDLRTVFGDAVALPTATLIERLKHPETWGLEADTPWGDLYGVGLESRRLAVLLRPYGVRPQKVTVNGANLQGYRRESLSDAWQRYVPVPPAPVAEGTE
jgi:Protein of unknown function (DUF3631)